MSYYQNYFWKHGKPYGARTGSLDDPLSFKVITDPYRKRFSVEQYESGRFIEVIYDSGLFDFRHLKSEECDAWQREQLTEPHSIIRNMDDRIILFEESLFENDRCRSCKIYSPHRIWIATQDIFYKKSGDLFNGVVLQDKTGRPILIKHYEADEETGAFTSLVKEQWEH